MVILIFMKLLLDPFGGILQRVPGTAHPAQPKSVFEKSEFPGSFPAGQFFGFSE